jgi:hypothetical protein
MTINQFFLSRASNETTTTTTTTAAIDRVQPVRAKDITLIMLFHSVELKTNGMLITRPS